MQCRIVATSGKAEAHSSHFLTWYTRRLAAHSSWRVERQEGGCLWTTRLHASLVIVGLNFVVCVPSLVVHGGEVSLWSV